MNVLVLWPPRPEAAMDLWQDARAVRAMLRDAGWRTPDTYVSKSFEPLISGSAVYLFLSYRRDEFARAIISYVGQSTNLYQRLSSHEIMNDLDEQDFWTARWFKPTPIAELRMIEREYIQRFNPPWNIIGRPRGFAHIPELGA